ncbi:MAG: hypothetical protein C5B43_00490 [Verrucomicrobia bacterium]|nr:MAG: hypothetical protein C5B43_00490 [Verrucomicrobiota bacterium]
MNKIKSDKIARTNEQLKESSNVNVLQGETKKSRVTETRLNEINSNVALYDREMAMLGENLTNYTQKVNRVIAYRIKVNIDLNNEVLIKNKKESFAYNQNDSIINLAYTAFETYLAVRKYGLMPELEKLVYGSAKNKTQAMESLKDESLKGIDLEAYENGVFCWKVMQKVFECEKKAFLNFEIKYNKNDKDEVFIPNINLLISKTCKELKQIKREFFSFFRNLLDPNLKIPRKQEIIDEFNPRFYDILKLKSLVLGDTGNEVQSFLDMTSLFLDIICNDISLLNRVIEILNTYKNAPKTLYSSKAIYIFLKICFDEFKDLKQNSQGNPFLNNRWKIKILLRDLLKKMADPINGVSTKNNLLIQNTKTSNQNTTIPQKEIVPQKTQSTNKKVSGNNKNTSKNRNNNNASVKQNVNLGPISNQKKENIKLSDDLKDKKNLEIHEEVHEGSNKEIEKEVKIAQKEESKISIQDPISSIIQDVIIEENLENDSLEDIDEEINGLMEVFRRYYEKDRVEKQRLKQERLMKSKKTINNEDDKIIDNGSNIISPTIQILGPKKQELVKNLFRKPLPGYRIILGKKVQSLITQLGGKSQGNKGNFEIYWNGSNKKAGDYEICHEGDTNGYLTPNYAKRVADAIYAGVISYGMIPTGYFTPELLKVIESHEITNNG